MTPKEVIKFVKDARERADANARKWHSNPKVKDAARRDYMSTVMKIRNQEWQISHGIRIHQVQGLGTPLDQSQE